MLCSFKFHLYLILVSVQFASLFCFIFYSHIGLLSHVLQMEFNNNCRLNTINFIIILQACIIIIIIVIVIIIIIIIIIPSIYSLINKWSC